MKCNKIAVTHKLRKEFDKEMDRLYLEQLIKTVSNNIAKEINNTIIKELEKKYGLKFLSFKFKGIEQINISLVNK